MEFLKLLFYKSYCWQRKMNPNDDSLFDAAVGFSALVTVWVGILPLVIVLLVDKIFDTFFLLVYLNVAEIIWFTMAIMSLALPYAWLLHKRNCFRFLLSMHRLYKDEYPDFMLEIFLFTALLLMGCMLVICFTC